jgi:hypothetical protein
MKASDSAVDAYASKVLEKMSPPEAFIDSSVGPYVTSLLRCADIQHKDEVNKLVEYESLLELLEDQCNMDEKVATEALKTIADAVVTQTVPMSEAAPSSHARLGLYTGGESSLDSFQSMRNHLPALNPTSDPYTPGSASAGGPSPLKPDNLIPVDLMGVLDDPSPNQQAGQHMFQQQSPYGSRVFQFHSPPPRPPGPHTHPLHRQILAVQQNQQQLPTLPLPQNRNYEGNDDNTPNNNSIEDFPPLGTSSEEFPPLGKASDDFPPLGASSTDKPKKSKASSAKKAGGKSSQQHSDKELAAALFRPARPRQNSIESEDFIGTGTATTSQQRSRGSSAGSLHAATSALDNGAISNNPYFQQQLASCVEILLSMNHDLSEEAATDAGLMANLDFNIAQYLVDSAMTAPPICRHMLHDGCYRSDCQFSHDVDGHTCLFWLRGRCGKGSSCKFLHGYNERLLDGIVSGDNATSMNGLGYTNHVYGDTYSYPIPLAQNAAAISGDAASGPFPASMASSWQTPSVVDVSSASNSYSSGDTSSFANIASKGYDPQKFSGVSPAEPSSSTNSVPGMTATVRIPQDLWNPHENRDSSVFYVADPLERYQQVASTTTRSDVIDLHFQSTKTFPVVLSTILPSMLGKMEEVWVVTGTGHHVGSKTHQKGGGALERSVIQWLTDEGYNFLRGKDRNGLGGALLVKR